jgi:flavoprotein
MNKDKINTSKIMFDNIGSQISCILDALGQKDCEICEGTGVKCTANGQDDFDVEFCQCSGCQNARELRESDDYDLMTCHTV